MEATESPSSPVVVTVPVLKHSGIGIASFVISMAAGVGMVLVFVVAGVMQLRMSGGLREHKVMAMVVGLIVLGLLLASLSGIGLAIGGLCQKERRKVFSALGLAFNLAILLGTIGLMLVGKMHQH
jgi:hypothetical protein